ncbi:MAG TPA: tetratricopeptide repeat protein [Pyrinomonadaceae bacterium]|nr:tetratricopeptide repeat protein [Pyrinomonadaceae bacterium]
MTDQPPLDQSDRIEAMKLFEAARDHAARGDWEEARKLYERSLELCEDPIVLDAYLKFLATVGPM